MQIILCPLRSGPIRYLEIQEPDSAKTIGTLFPAVSSPHDPSLFLLTTTCLPLVYGRPSDFRYRGSAPAVLGRGEGSREEFTLSFDDIRG